MPLFLVKAPDKGIEMLVSARCLTCARDVAAENAGAEGTLVWRDREQSSVQLIQDSSKRAVLAKWESRQHGS